MSAISLNTFGSVLTFAVELEDALQKFYEAASSFGEPFEDYARKSAKRKQRLIATRQDNVTEIVLEPITGLDGNRYAVDSSAPADVAAAKAQASHNEAQAEQFYLDSGPKLNVTEARRLFAKLAQESAERRAAF